MSASAESGYLPRVTGIARQGGRLLMEYFSRRIGFEYKGDVDLVTEADRASEKLIVAQLRQNWPDYDLIGEEGSRDDRGSEYRWYVDPLDGTTNFAHGYPVFCVSIGLEKAGELILGVLYDPTRDEMFAAEKGAGATLNGKPIYVSKTKQLCEAILGTGFPSHKRHKNPNIHFYHQLTLRSHGVRRAGSAALDLANVAAGRYDGFWEFNLNPWDTIAGVVLVREAGGTVTRFDGTPFRLDSREVLASNGLLHAELMQNFAEIFAGRGLEEPPSPVDYAAQRKV
ncbi:MAG TPA: inositol monophosphatase family protein [Candidatus Acidoferrales bacterium]|nr:inositol monophosphatase family protein [Candidatus Acidoferrales bacterium]